MYFLTVILGVRALSPSTPSHHRARSLHTIHPPIVHKRWWWRALDVPGSGAAAASSHVESAPRADDIADCGLGSRACFSPTTANPPSVLMTTSR